MSSPLDLGQVGVLMGGVSSEREISFKSGRAVVEALSEQGCRVKAIEINSVDLNANLSLLRDAHVDVAFIALHGAFGEDGGIQHILEVAGIPYTGSDAQTSRLTINKVLTQQILKEKGILVPQHCVLKKGERNGCSRIQNIFGTSRVVIKPACEGSSIGITIVDDPKNLETALQLAFSYGSEVLAEQYIGGRELTAGILDGQALPLVEICSKNSFFDFDAKYHKGMTEYLVPAPVEEGLSRRIQEEAVKANQILGCRDLSRIDFILDPEERAYLLEINTIPGFTETSLLPKAARQKGINFGELCLKISRLAAARRKISTSKV